MRKTGEVYMELCNQKYPLEKIGKNVIFLKNFISNPNIVVGDYTYYNDFHHPENFERDNVVFGFFAKLTIGRYCQIGQGSTFFLNDCNHQMSGFSTYPFFVFGNHNESCPSWSDYELDLPNKGDTIIGNDVWLGNDASVMPGVHVGDGAIIAAKAVVTKNVKPYTIVAGNPAKVVRQRFSDDVIEKLLEIRWWDWDFDKVSRNIAAIVGGDIEALQKA